VHLIEDPQLSSVYQDIPAESASSQDEDTDHHQDSDLPSLTANLPPPIHYTSVVVTPVTPHQDLPAKLSPYISTVLTEGVSLQPLLAEPRVFCDTTPFTLMDEILHDMQQHCLIQDNPNVTNAFCTFLVEKCNGATRLIVEISPWTPLLHYTAHSSVICSRGDFSYQPC
jgi:hypothetical protein